jgi:hypothetical protein
LIGFIGTGLLILLVVLEDAIARRGRPWEALGSLLFGAVHCPFLAIVAAAVGAGLGIWIENPDWPDQVAPWEILDARPGRG